MGITKNEILNKRLHQGKLYGLLFCLFFFFSSFCLAQIPIQHWQFGDTGIENVTQLICDENGGYYFAGTFTETFSIDSEMLSPIGEDDIFVGKVDELGQIVWVWNTGSAFDDEVSGIALSDEGHLFLTGSFWLEAQFGDFLLTSEGSSKSIFLLQMATETGEITWAKALSGTDIKIVTDLQLTSNDDILLSGYFSDIFFIDNTTLSANADTDIFLAKFNSSGELSWATNKGTTGVTQSSKSTLLSDGKIILSGIFNDTLVLANHQMVAETSDNDVFIACFDENGEVIWATKAGGVHDEFIHGLARDEFDNIYLSGNLVGVIDLEDGTSIQSGNGFADLFLLKYTPEGQVINAIAFGGDALQQNTDLVVKEDYVLLTGNFQGIMTVGENNYDAVENIAGFILQFNPDLEPKNGWAIRSDNFVFPTKVFFDNDNNIFISGSFGGEIAGISGLNPALGVFDAFIFKYAETVVETKSIVDITSTINIFPNPTSHELFIDTTLENYTVTLVNVKGITVFEAKNVTQISLFKIPIGVYYLTIEKNDLYWQKKVLIQR